LRARATASTSLRPGCIGGASSAGVIGRGSTPEVASKGGRATGVVAIGESHPTIGRGCRRTGTHRGLTVARSTLRPGSVCEDSHTGHCRWWSSRVVAREGGLAPVVVCAGETYSTVGGSSGRSKTLRSCALAGANSPPWCVRVDSVRADHRSSRTTPNVAAEARHTAGVVAVRKGHLTVQRSGGRSGTLGH